MYSDLNLDFNMNPFTGDIIKATNAEAIKKSFRNLILTNYFEVPFHPEIGSSIRGMLFENYTPLTNEFLKTKIRELAEEKEPRVKIRSIEIIQEQDYNSLKLDITYQIIELNKQDNITIFVNRTR